MLYALDLLCCSQQPRDSWHLMSSISSGISLSIARRSEWC